MICNIPRSDIARLNAIAKGCDCDHLSVLALADTLAKLSLRDKEPTKGSQ